MKTPPASEFGKKHGEIPETVKQTDWLNLMKNNGCIGCHQMGQLSTRTFPKGPGEVSTHAEAWTRRTQAGQSGGQMVNILARQLHFAPAQHFHLSSERNVKVHEPLNERTPAPQIEPNPLVSTRYL